MTGSTRSMPNLTEDARERCQIACSWRAARILVAMTVIITCHLGVFVPPVVAQSHMAQDGDISLEVTFIGTDGTVSACEPLLARIELLNQAEDAVHIYLGNGVEPNTYVEVRDQGGAILASTPRPHPEDGGIQGGCTIEPGEVYSEIWVLTGLYQFRQPGVYTIHFALLDWERGLPVIAEETLSLEVLPFDGARLEARCQELFDGMWGPRRASETSVPRAVAATAIYSVRHDIALPYLDWMAREWHTRYTCRAIHRIGSERSAKLAEVLGARTDSVGTAMEQATRLGDETRYRDYGP